MRGARRTRAVKLKGNTKAHGNWRSLSKRRRMFVLHIGGMIQPHQPTPLCYYNIDPFGISMMLPGQRRPYGRAAKAMRPALSEVKRCGQQSKDSKRDIVSDAACPRAARKRSTERYSKRNSRPSDNKTAVTRTVHRRMSCMYKRRARIGNQVRSNSVPFAIIRSLYFGRFSTYIGGTYSRSPIFF
jgi:hypothetical protein